MKLLLRWFINAVALLAATQIISGFQVDSFYAALIAALVLGLLNALVRPLLLLLTLPLTIVTLGLFTFVINALMVWFMSSFVKGVEVAGFWPALMVSLILWAVGTLTNAALHSPDEQAPR
ncbi:phage holin family protein [bacterium]|jgi:putative membrane protein|nr:phage holin family protein [bacterium]NBX50051.1 phage holin family protein [bacterium]